MWKCFYVKYPLFVSGCIKKYNFLYRFSNKKPKYKISSKSVQWEPNCSMRTDRRTDITKLIFASRNFANAPKIIRWLHLCDIVVSVTWLRTIGKANDCQRISSRVLTSCRLWLTSAPTKPNYWQSSAYSELTITIILFSGFFRSKAKCGWLVKL
jgi:hypothetical protein